MRRLTLYAIAVVLYATALFAAERPRVIVVSFDGAGHQMTTRLIDEGKLPSFARLRSRGAWSDGMVTSFPTKTAAAHAMLFTGHYGHTSGITANAVLKLPREEHTLLESESGYFSGPLRVDPVWVAAARRGVPSYVLHGTQAYPFGDEAGLEALFVAHGYTEIQDRAAAIPPVSLAPPASGWRVPEARGPEARELAFRVGDSRFFGLFFDDPFDPASGCDTLGIVADRAEETFLATVKGGDAASFSTPVLASAKGADVWFSLRLFHLAPDASDFTLFRTGAVEVAVSRPRYSGRGALTLEVFDGNGGSRVYGEGALGLRRSDGGDGRAEDRLLETEEHLQDQILAQTRLVLEEDYGLAVLYSPVTDEIAHTFAGLVSASLDGYDADLADAIWPVIARGFAIQDRMLGELLDRADRDGAHVLVVSDHGMAATDRWVHLNVALEQAGLLALDTERRIDLSRTKALALPTDDASVAVNTIDRRGGIVPMSEKSNVLDDVRRVLEALADPDTGERVVAQMLEPSTVGLIQPGGPGTGDLFLDFAPGYYPSARTGPRDVIERSSSGPAGTHVFLPTRREMRAIFGAYGPRFPAGFNVGRVRGIDVVPTVWDLLGLDVPSELPGRSLVPERGVLQEPR